MKKLERRSTVDGLPQSLYYSTTKDITAFFFKFIVSIFLSGGKRYDLINNFNERKDTMAKFKGACIFGQSGGPRL